jgi:hypothetical protein
MTTPKIRAAKVGVIDKNAKDKLGFVRKKAKMSRCFIKKTYNFS